MKRQQPEYKLQCAVVQHLKLRQKPGVYWAAIPNGEVRSARSGARLKAMGVRAGAPDLFVIAGGRANAIEFKHGNGRLSPAQKQAAIEWEAAGGAFHVASNIDEALGVLAGIGAIPAENTDLNLRRLREIPSDGEG
jgi:hypothetical protein